MIRMFFKPRTAPVAVLALSLGTGMALAQDATVYPTPQDALETLMTAIGAASPDAVIAALGPSAADMVEEDNDDERAENLAELMMAYKEGYRFVPQDDGSVVVEMGDDDWPFPIPIMKADGGGWSFDIEGGREEIVDRIIGLNELDAIDTLEAYVGVQSEFRSVDHDGDGVMEFAAHIISSAEDRDGLYWPGGDSPIGDLVARANLGGFAGEDGPTEAQDYQGYFFRILDGQGDAAPGGAMSYLVNGNMVAGHAMLAIPAEYGETGIHSFMVSENGEVLEADLGEDTLETGFAMTAFDPDDKWAPAE